MFKKICALVLEIMQHVGVRLFSGLFLERLIFFRLLGLFIHSFIKRVSVVPDRLTSSYSNPRVPGGMSPRLHWSELQDTQGISKASDLGAGGVSCVWRAGQSSGKTGLRPCAPVICILSCSPGTV